MSTLDYFGRPVEPPVFCSVEGCGRTHHSQGLCTTHYSRLNRGYDLHAPIRKPARKLTAEQIAIARSSRLTHAALAEAYNVAPSTIFNARKGRHE